MIVPIVFIIIGTCFFYRMDKYEGDEFDKPRRGSISLGLAGSYIGLLVAFLTIAATMVTAPGVIRCYEIEKKELVALENSREVQGSFFLGCGNINNEQYYVFFYNTPNGGKKFDKINAKNTIIYEENRKDAYLAKEVMEKRYSDKIRQWLIPKFIGNICFFNNYIIRVPKGTIRTGYNLSLE